MKTQKINDEKYEKMWRKKNAPKLEQIFLKAQIKYNKIRLKELVKQKGVKND